MLTDATLARLIDNGLYAWPLNREESVALLREFQAARVLAPYAWHMVPCVTQDDEEEVCDCGYQAALDAYQDARG